MRSLALAALAFAALLACAGEPPESCGAVGRVASCPCPGGAQGAQECGPLGVWGACACPGTDAGAEAAAPDAPPPPADGPAGPEAGVDAPEVAADAPAPPDGPREAAVDATPDGPLVCMEPMANCDRDPTNGCEVNFRADPMHCGGCGQRCVNDHVARSGCEGGACTVAACEPAFADCDRNVNNGCEVNIRESMSDCGGCGMRCDPLGTLASCVAGVCVRGACAPGFADCDGEPTNGCETDVRTSSLHCGRCTIPCASPRACVAGACVMR